jgi:anti-sigma B factor antagonist
MARDKATDVAGAASLIELGALSMRSAREGDVHTVALFGELDLAVAPQVQRELDRVDRTDAESIVLDLSGLTFMDSTGIRLVLRVHRRSHIGADRLTLRRGPEAVQRVFAISGVEDVLPFVD